MSYFLSTALVAILIGGAVLLCNFGRGHYEEHFCEIILDLDQRLRRKDVLKKILSTAQAALLFGREEPLVQFL